MCGVWRTVCKLAMRLILPRRISAFLLQQHVAQVIPISVFDIFVLSTYNLVAWTLQHRKDIEPSTQEESMSTPCRFPCPLGGFCHHQSAMYREHGGVLTAPRLSAGEPAMYSYLCGCCWSAALLRAFAGDSSQRGGSTIIICVASYA